MLREELKLSNAGLARLLGISRQTCWKRAQAVRMPRIDTVTEMLRTLARHGVEMRITVDPGGVVVKTVWVSPRAVELLKALR